MKCLLRQLVCLVCIGACGCHGRDASTSAKPLRRDDLVGKWRLVRAGGEPPSAMNIKSLQIDVLIDGTWTSDIEMQGQFAGMSMKGGGTWLLANNEIAYTSGANSGTSKARLSGGVLVLDPDFSVRRAGKEAVTGEYER